VSSLYNLPKNWKWATLGEITDTTSGGTPKRTNKDYWNGSINWLKSGELNDGYIYDVEETITEEGLKKSSAKIFKTGTLLMAMYGATVGRLGILKVDTSTNQAVCAIFNRFNLFNNEYIFFYLKYTRQQMLEDSFGGAQPNLSQGYINNINIPFAPFNEQKRIVTKIEKLFSNLDKSDQHLVHLEKQLKRYRQSILKSTFENEKAENWVTLENIFEIERGGSPRPIKNFLTDADDGINWIKIGDTKVGQKYIEFTKEKIKPEGLKKSRLVIEGDFILSNSMSFGRPYIMKTTGAIHDGWLVFREKMDNINKDYFYYLLSSAYMYQQFSVKASGSTVKNLNKELVKTIKVPLPTETEQANIVKQIEKHFSIIDKLEAVVQKSIKESKRLRQSILKQAFEGKLVEQDPSDESATILLEKITKAKEEYKKEMKKGKKK